MTSEVVQLGIVLVRAGDEWRAHLAEDLRDSGQIEQDADLIFMLYREYVYDPSADAHRLEMNLVKHRNGPQASFALYWEGVTTRVQDAKANVIDLSALAVGAL